MEAFFPGQYAAEAIMQLLVGAVSPSGLLPVTVYDADYINRRPITLLDLRASGGVTYRYFEGTPLWPFGFGLSYADVSFKAKNGSAIIHTTVAVPDYEHLCFEVYVTNADSGVAGAGADVGADVTASAGAGVGMAVDVVVLAFIKSDHSDAPRNPKLADFVREDAIRVGEQRTVLVCVGPDSLPLVSDDGKERVLPGEYGVTVGVKGGVGGDGAGSLVGTIVVHA